MVALPLHGVLCGSGGVGVCGREALGFAAHRMATALYEDMFEALKIGKEHVDIRRELEAAWHLGGCMFAAFFTLVAFFTGLMVAAIILTNA